MKIKCPGCSRTLNIPESAAGKVVKCPCGKQLRAPAGAKSAASPSAAPRAGSAPGRAAAPAGKPPARKTPARKTPARKPAGRGIDAFDDSLFDELTDQDLQPIGSNAAAKTSGASSHTARLLNEQAGTGGDGKSFQGDLASPVSRLVAAIIDGFVIQLMTLPVILVAFFVMQPFDAATLEEVGTMSDVEARALYLDFIQDNWLFFLVVLPAAFIAPVVLYAWMIVKSGQTPGKKLAKVRIVMSETRQLPDFVHGVLIRSWLVQMAYSIPFAGGLIALVDLLLIFRESRQTLHDQLAGTIVIEA